MPFLPKRTISAHGMCLMSRSASSASASVARLKLMPRVSWRADRKIDVGIAIAKHVRQQCADQIDILVAVDVVDLAAVAVGDEQRRGAGRKLDAALGEGLRAERDHLFGTREHLLRTVEFASKIEALRCKCGGESGVARLAAVEVAQLWLAVEHGEHIEMRRCAVRRQACGDGLQKREVVGGVERPALASEAGQRRDQRSRP